MFNWKVKSIWPSLLIRIHSCSVKSVQCVLFIFCVYSSIHVIGSFFVHIEISHLVNWDRMLCNAPYGILLSLDCIQHCLYSRHSNRSLYLTFCSIEVSIASKDAFHDICDTLCKEQNTTCAVPIVLWMLNHFIFIIECVIH